MIFNQQKNDKKVDQKNIYQNNANRCVAPPIPRKMDSRNLPWPLNKIVEFMNDTGQREWEKYQEERKRGIVR